MTSIKCLTIFFFLVRLHRPICFFNFISPLLNTYLLRAYGEGLRVVLIIDEAQNLSFEALEQVRLLTNLETDTQKLLQIILLGQPELRELLAREDLRQLAQRITARFHLTPLDAGELEQVLRPRQGLAQRAKALIDAGRPLHRQPLLDVGQMRVPIGVHLRLQLVPGRFERSVVDRVATMQPEQREEVLGEVDAHRPRLRR